MQDEIAEIVRVQVKQLEKMLAKNHIKIGFTEEVVQQLAEEGLDPQFGARPLKRVIQKEVENRIARAILDGTIRDGDNVQIDAKDGKLLIEPKANSLGARSEATI